MRFCEMIKSKTRKQRQFRYKGSSGGTAFFHGLWLHRKAPLAFRTLPIAPLPTKSSHHPSCTLSALQPGSSSLEPLVLQRQTAPSLSKPPAPGSPDMLMDLSGVPKSSGSWASFCSNRPLGHRHFHRADACARGWKPLPPEMCESELLAWDEVEQTLQAAAMAVEATVGMFPPGMC